MGIYDPIPRGQPSGPYGKNFDHAIEPGPRRPSAISIVQVCATMQQDRVHTQPFINRGSPMGGTITIGSEQMYQRVIEQIRLMVGGHEGGDLSIHDLKDFEAKK